MKKLDRLAWAEGLAFSAFGVRIGFRVNVPGMMPRLLAFLPSGWKKSSGVLVERLYSLFVGGSSAPGVRRLNVLYADSSRLARGTDLDQVLQALETDLHLYTATESSDCTFLHAGVVGWRGHAIVIPGRSFTGKTTLVREMLRLGATYYSDEFAVVDNSGFVRPFARPLGIRTTNSGVQRKCFAEGLGATTGTKPLPGCLVVLTEYNKKGRWQPTRLSQGQGTLELLANCIAIRNEPRKHLTRLHKLARRGLFFSSIRGEARETAASILASSCWFAPSERS